MDAKYLIITWDSIELISHWKYISGYVSVTGSSWALIYFTRLAPRLNLCIFQSEEEKKLCVQLKIVTEKSNVGTKKRKHQIYNSQRTFRPSTMNTTIILASITSYKVKEVIQSTHVNRLVNWHTSTRTHACKHLFIYLCKHQKKPQKVEN